MRVPSHMCHKCQGFMSIEKENDDYVMRCLACDKKKEEPKKE